MTAVGPLDRVFEEVRGREDRVGDAEVERLRGLQHAVLLERVRDDDLERVLDADEVRQQVRAAPARDDAEEDLGQRDRRYGGVDRAVVRVQRDLEAAAEREPVDEHERRHAELA